MSSFLCQRENMETFGRIFHLYTINPIVWRFSSILEDILLGNILYYNFILYEEIYFVSIHDGNFFVLIPDFRGRFDYSKDISD